MDDNPRGRDRGCLKILSRRPMLKGDGVATSGTGPDSVCFPLGAIEIDGDDKDFLKTGMRFELTTTLDVDEVSIAPPRVTTVYHRLMTTSRCRDSRRKEGCDVMVKWIWIVLPPRWEMVPAGLAPAVVLGKHPCRRCIQTKRERAGGIEAWCDWPLGRWLGGPNLPSSVKATRSRRRFGGRASEQAAD